MAIIASIARRRNFPVEEPVPLREIPAHHLARFPALMMPVVLLGGIYSGITTPTEAAALAAAYALLVSVAALSQRQLRGASTARCSSAPAPPPRSAC